MRTYVLTDMRTYVLTDMRTYVLTDMRTYVLTDMRTYVLTDMRIRERNNTMKNVCVILKFSKQSGSQIVSTSEPEKWSTKYVVEQVRPEILNIKKKSRPTVGVNIKFLYHLKITVVLRRPNVLKTVTFYRFNGVYTVTIFTRHFHLTPPKSINSRNNRRTRAKLARREAINT